jgi:tRNA modification GTPase
LRQARRLVAGELGRTVDALRDRVVGLRVEIEVNLDFPEEVARRDRARWREEVGGLSGTLQDWLAGFEAGRRARERARVVLAGPTNAGKSSLFNALLGRARALVSPVPGTTRDYVEAELEIDGYVCVLVDTAGLREAKDAVERAGVALADEQREGADLVLWVEGADTEPDAADADARLDDVAHVRVETKRDLGERRGEWIGASAGEGGAEAVRDAIRAWFASGADQAWIGLARHRDRVREADEALVRAAGLLERRDEPLELVAFELGVAASRLGDITGRHALGAAGTEVLDAIFSRFCIGK